LSMGQRSSFQRWMAVSSRWVARRSGFCRLQPPIFKMRPTWEGSYEAPNSHRITSATRGWVHRSPWNPKDWAPWARSWGSCALCSQVNRGGAPGDVRCRSDSIPPPLARFTHWLTAPLLTPSASAMSSPISSGPLWCNSKARNRRPSRQLVTRWRVSFP
jgi:hypothetical protein